MTRGPKLLVLDHSASNHHTKMSSTGEDGKSLKSTQQKGSGSRLKQVVAQLQPITSIRQALQPANALEKHYYRVTWIAFLCLFASLALIEIGLMIMSQVHTPFMCYYYMEPTVLDLISMFEQMQTAPPSEKIGLLQKIMLSRQGLIDIYNQHRGGDRWAFWINYYANLVVGVIVIAAWIGCYVFRQRPTVKARGWFFLNQFMFSMLASFVARDVFFANLVGYLDPAGDYLDFTNFKTVDSALESKERMITRQFVAGFFVSFFLTMFFSAIVQRQRIIQLMFRGRALHVLGRYEYYRLLLITVPFSFVIYSFMFVWIYALDARLKYMHVITDAFILFQIFFLSLLYKYSEGLSGMGVDLKFMDYHNNVRVIGAMLSFMCLTIAMTIISPGRTLFFFSSNGVIRVTGCLWILDSLATQIAYEKIMAPERNAMCGPVALTNLTQVKIEPTPGMHVTANKKHDIDVMISQASLVHINISTSDKP